MTMAVIFWFGFCGFKTGNDFFINLNISL